MVAHHMLKLTAAQATQKTPGEVGHRGSMGQFINTGG